jgi:hypothetical protein
MTVVSIFDKGKKVQKYHIVGSYREHGEKVACSLDLCIRKR